MASCGYDRHEVCDVMCSSGVATNPLSGADPAASSATRDTNSPTFGGADTREAGVQGRCVGDGGAGPASGSFLDELTMCG